LHSTAHIAKQTKRIQKEEKEYNKITIVTFSRTFGCTY